MSASGTDDGDDETCYTMTTAAGAALSPETPISWKFGNQVDHKLAVKTMEAWSCAPNPGGKGIKHLEPPAWSGTETGTCGRETRIKVERIGGVSSTIMGLEWSGLLPLIWLCPGRSRSR